MVQLDKRYFPLKEIAKRWGLRKRDLVYMAEVGELRTSVRIPGAHIEVGMLEASQDQRVRVRYERSWFTGLQDLTTEDAFLVFRNGEADVREFHTGIAEEYICISTPSPAVRVRPEHLVVRRVERDRIEAKHRESGQSVAAGLGFQHSPDYRFVRLGEVVMRLGVVQARIIRLLHQAAQSPNPWCSGRSILVEADAASRRMSDVFKSQPDWRAFIESDERGRYRLRLVPPSCGTGGIVIPHRPS
jgi:hypothetical protein